MVLQSSGPISFYDLQTEFGGSYPISLDEYYLNANTNYTNNVNGIPNIGQAISLGHFYGKQKQNVGKQ